MTLHRTYRESVDKQIIDFFYSGLSISSISKKMKECICGMDSNIKTSADVRGYVYHVIYNYQMTNN